MKTFYKNTLLLKEDFEDGNVVLLDEKSGDVHVLNASAAVLFEICDGRPEGALLTDYLSRFLLDDDAAAEAERDFHAVLADMTAKELIKVA